MQFTMTKVIGKNEFKFTDQVSDAKEWFKKASFFSGLPTHCGNCKAAAVRPEYRLTSEGYEFYEMKCEACGYGLKYGQAKQGGGLFAKKWEAPVVGKQEKAPPPEDSHRPNFDEEDINL